MLSNIKENASILLVLGAMNRVEKKTMKNDRNSARSNIEEERIHQKVFTELTWKRRFGLTYHLQLRLPDQRVFWEQIQILDVRQLLRV